MPLYEYVCRACGAETEQLQKLSDPLLTDCPDCGAPDLTKKISAAGFRLKGGGWYETDFKQDKRRNLAAEGGEDKKKPEAAEAKSDGSDAKSGGDSKSDKTKSDTKAKGKGKGKGSDGGKQAANG